MNKTFGQADPRLEAYVYDTYRPEDDFLAGIRARQKAAGMPEIQVAPLDARHLEVIARAIGARRVVEVGTLGGYSAACLLRGMAPGGVLHTFELSEKHAEVARETFELGGRLSYYPVEEQDSVLLMVQPKLGIMPRKLAVILPAGLVLTDEDHGWELTPGVLYTHFFTPNVSLETAGKLLIAIQDDFGDSNTLVGANVGMRFVPNGGRWGLQPEFGFYIDPNEDGAFTQLGVAFVYELGPRDPDRMGPPPGPPPG